MTSFPDLETELSREFARRAEAAVFNDEAFSPDVCLRAPAADGPRSAGRGRAFVWIVSAAALLLVALVAVARIDSDSTDRADEPTAGGAGVALSDVDQIFDDEWVVPDDDAFVLDLALDDAPTPFGRNAEFRRGDVFDPAVKVRIESPELHEEMKQYNGPWTDETIGGLRWSRSADGRQFVASVGDHNVRVERGAELSEDELRAVIGGLRVVTESSLSLPVLRMDDQTNATDVATVERADGPYTIRAVTDGQNFCLSLVRGQPGMTADGGGGGCGNRLRPGQFIAPQGAEGPDPQALAAGLPVESTVYGIVDRNVANVVIHLRDGTVVTTEPQDLTGTMPVKFYVAVIPTETEQGLEQLDYIEAQDADGNELGRGSMS